MSPFSTSRLTAVSFAMWKIVTYKQLHWQVAYVSIFHIATAAVSFAMWTLGIYEQLHWQLSDVSIFHIATDRRVIRDVENEHL